MEKPSSYLEELKQQFPDANIREDSEHFIYDLKDTNGKSVEVHTPKWEKIPVTLADDTVVHVPVFDVIRAELKHRHEFGDDFSLAEALRREGLL